MCLFDLAKLVIDIMYDWPYNIHLHTTVEVFMNVIVIIGLVVLAVVFGPLLSIWALNALFPLLAIPYTWETWLAVILLKGLITFQVNKWNS